MATYLPNLPNSKSDTMQNSHDTRFALRAAPLSNFLSNPTPSLCSTNTFPHSDSELHFSLQALSPLHQFPYEQEKLLLSSIHSHNTYETGNTLNNLLGYVILPERNNLLSRKNRVLEITSVLTRVLIEIGADDEKLLVLSNSCEKILTNALTYDELCEKLQQMTDFFLQCIQSPGPRSNSQTAVCQARGYIARHYASRLTLHEVADYVHLNPSYFSSVFKKNYGMSFTAFLNRIRIEKSRQLLADTNYDILDIAIAAGFEDQSYFTKKFRQIVGQSPKQYRASL